MLRPTAIPAETTRLARTGFPTGAPVLRLRRELNVFPTDQEFIDLHPQRGNLRRPLVMNVIPQTSGDNSARCRPLRSRHPYFTSTANGAALSLPKPRLRSSQ